MTRPPGRDQSAPMERLVRLIGVLTQHPGGASAAMLLRALGAEDASDDARRRMLNRDLEQLNRLGYDIRNVAEVGSEGHYVMRARDNRLQVHLTAEQRGELLRAALASGLTGLAAQLGEETAGDQMSTSPNLDLAQRANARRCRIRFTYKGEPRLVHPARVHSGPSGWYLSGREETGEVIKEFVVSRMSDVSLDPPGTADVVEQTSRPSLDPLRWLVDPPTEVVLAVAADQRLLVENLLGTPLRTDHLGDELVLTVLVTHRAVFRARLYELGTRVRLVGPDEVRAEVLAELEDYLKATT